ncbi:Gfo/Idh/MocA family oxidoreductase [uncultured Gimesia sp.]|uniref:Gfo/Idh/MocA family protein n=1 Tax=uncultured Gimesia sp. TaxID=1678688 RepID=UPI00261C36F7|nr:Gfo/Idh/MocA family oxidoreductase [uncultured Gimesia sp.]
MTFSRDKLYGLSKDIYCLHLKSWCVTFFSMFLILAIPALNTDAKDKVIRVGMIGLDTSHVISFTKMINDPQAQGDLADIRIVAAFPGGSPSFPLSRDRVAGFTDQIRKMGIEISSSIPDLLKKVDVVMLESVDGSQHLEQVKQVFEAGKPVFIDKPFTASLTDAVAIQQLSRKHGVPFFSCSSKRYSRDLLALMDAKKLGKIIGCDVYGTSKSVPNHPDLFWYGVHGNEMLFTIMGSGCVSVSARQTPAFEQVTGVWKDGRVGTFRGIRDEGGRPGFGATVFGEKRTMYHAVGGDKDGLMQEIARFFKTGKPPVSPEKTVEIFAFMEAAEESKRLGGVPVTIDSVLKQATKVAKKLITSTKTKTPYEIATFRVDVTCPLGHPLLARRQGIAKSIGDPLYAHGITLLGAGRPIVIVAVDWCEIRNDAYDHWREVLATAAGTTPERVVLCAVHQHDAPLPDIGAQKILDEVDMAGVMCDVGFFKATGKHIAASLRDSLTQRRSITHLGLGQSKVDRIASNRRVVLDNGKVTFRRGSNGSSDRINREAPEGLIDPWLKAISFWDGNQPIAVISAYATHPMSHYGRGVVSSDFVGMAREFRRRDDLSILQMYVSGCSGDVTAGKYNDASPENRPVLAKRLYDAMKVSWESTRRVPIEQITFRSTSLELEFRKTDEYTETAMRRVLNNKSATQRDRVHAAMGLSTLKRLQAGCAIDMPCIDFGAAQIVLFPGESFVGYQIFAQKLRPDSFVMSIGYGECWPGYLPTQAAFKDNFDGHYWLWVAPGAEERITAALKRVLLPGKQKN